MTRLFVSAVTTALLLVRMVLLAVMSLFQLAFGGAPMRARAASD